MPPKDVNLEDFLITRSSIQGFEEMVFSEGFIDSDKRLETVFKQFKQDNKYIPSAREYLALSLQMIKEMRSFRKTLKEKYPEKKEIVDNFINGLLGMNGAGRQFGSRSTSILFKEGEKGYLAFGELSNSDILDYRRDPYHSMKEEPVKKFIEQARIHKRVIKEPPHDDSRRGYGLSSSSPKEFASIELFKALFGRDLIEPFINIFRKEARFGVSIDFDASDLDIMDSLKDVQQPYCYRNNLYFSNGSIVLNMVPIYAVYKTVTNPINFSNKK